MQDARLAIVREASFCEALFFSVGLTLTRLVGAAQILGERRRRVTLGSRSLSSKARTET